MLCLAYLLFFFFFNDTATTEIYTLSLHDALPISIEAVQALGRHAHEVHLGALGRGGEIPRARVVAGLVEDRKSTRLNSSHSQISYAVFCLKKKKKKKTTTTSIFIHRIAAPHSIMH